MSVKSNFGGDRSIYNMKKSFILLFTIILNFILALTATDFEHASTNPLIWYPTREKVDGGSIYVEVTYTHKSPCDAVLATFNQPESDVQEGAKLSSSQRSGWLLLQSLG